MNAYTPLSTGYGAHAEARHGAQTAQAVVEAVNLNVPSDEEMTEDSDNVFGVQCIPKGMVVDRYGKAAVKVYPEMYMALR